MARVKAVVIGASAGGVQALLELLPSLPVDFPVPVLVVLHIPPDRTNVLATLFDARCAMTVKEAEDKDTAVPGVIYFAPSDYHLLVEANGDLALSTEKPVNFSRPSIDVLFESAADTYCPDLMAILLTGANDDGARGLSAVATAGGTVLVEDPDSAYARPMPEAGLKHCPSAAALSLKDIASQLRVIERA